LNQYFWLAAALSLILACVFRGDYNIKVVGDAMEPNFSDGELVSIEPLRDLSDLKRGDVIIFVRADQMYLKRLIGLPNETIEIRKGTILIDGESYVEPYDIMPASYEEFAVNLDDDEYYVLGDNRDNSSDSHIFGAIDGEQIIGRVVPR
jgi:signal peptidase I